MRVWCTARPPNSFISQTDSYPVLSSEQFGEGTARINRCADSVPTRTQATNPTVQTTRLMVAQTTAEKSGYALGRNEIAEIPHQRFYHVVWR